MSNSIIIRFANGATQAQKDDILDTETPFKRYIGCVPAKYMLPLLDNVGLAANPRSSRRNAVVGDILSTLQSSPELFHYKSKGLLIGAANCRPRQRNRYALRFDDPTIEGVLDGGHNLLAIGLYMLKYVMEERDWQKLKSWDDMKQAWSEYRTEIENEKLIFDFLVPVELLVPANDDADKDEFLMPLIEVCEARNNNVQLPIEAKSNKQGFYDEIKRALPSSLAKRVEWKPNEWDDESEQRPIKVRNLVALAWLPLNVLNEHNALPNEISVKPQSIYSNKGECSKRFEELMSLDEITEEEKGARRKLIHEGVKSAFSVLADLPGIYDLIYEQFPMAYNQNGKRFGANPIVKIYDPEKRSKAQANGRETNPYLRSRPRTPFIRRPVHYAYPEGLLIPLIYGLTGLMAVENGEVRWVVDDLEDFIEKNLPSVAESYGLVLDLGNWDPTKISKDTTTYKFAAGLFSSALGQN